MWCGYYLKGGGGDPTKNIFYEHKKSMQVASLEKDGLWRLHHPMWGKKRKKKREP